jgi:asparagine synthase (glutamine-hydrolysing)
MCGIIGSIGAQPNAAWVEGSEPFLHHRGPDNFFFKKATHEVILGAARLAMTDPLPRSNQPMTDKNSGNVIVFNGEIYNYRELRNELLAEGYPFSTDSDTEVLLAGLTIHGVNFLPRLNGMFAFCFYDAECETVTLARDSLGKKPLYYTVENDNLNFSSSQDALRSILTKKSQDENGVEDFLLLGYFIDTSTSNPSIKSILPGEVLKVKVCSPIKLTKTRIGPFQTDVVPTNLRECLTSAIKSRIESHDRVAISLSGGLDSTLVALILSEVRPESSAFSASWPDSDKSRYNYDSDVASLTAKRLGINFNKVEVFKSSELEKMLNLYLEVMEEPNNNSTGLSMLNLYKSMNEYGFRLALTGDGADEIFGGYARYANSQKIPNLLTLKSKNIQEIFLNQKIQKLGNMLGSQLDSKLISKYLKWHLIFTPKEISQLNPKISAKRTTQRLLTELHYKIDLSADSTKENFMAFDSQLWLRMESNRRLDRVSMKYSIEARSPFQDELVRAFAKELVHNEDSQISKRELLVRAFPELAEIKLQKEKVGFISPIGHWLRSNRKLVNDSIHYLASNHGYSRTILTDLNNAPDRGKYSEMNKLWTLVVLAQWNMNHAK